MLFCNFRLSLPEGAPPSNVHYARLCICLDESLTSKKFKWGYFPRNLPKINLDPKNEEAKKYLRLANQKIADNQIRILFNQYVESVKNRTLADFYRSHCTSKIYQEKKDDVEMLFSFYDDVKIAVSNFSVQIKGTSRAEINFSRMITGIYRADGKKKVLSEGMVKWEINKQGNVWRIIDIQ